MLFRAKVTADLMAKALAAVPEGELPVILWDGYGDLGDISTAVVVSVLEAQPSILDKLPRNCRIIYACTQDDLGLPFIAHLHDLGRPYVTLASAEPLGYITTNTRARTSLETEYSHQRALGFDKWDFGPSDFVALIQVLEITRELAGVYLEVGCYRGSSGGVVLRYMANTGLRRDCHFIDVFDGFNYPEARSSSDSVWVGTHKTEGHELVTQRLLDYRNFNADRPLNIQVHSANVITDPLPDDVLNNGVAVANIDVDLHEAVLEALRKVAPHVVQHGVMVVEDPGHTPMLIGASLALQVFMNEGGRLDFIPITLDSGQTLLIRR